MLRQQLNDALKEAMKAQQSRAVSTLRLILAALKDRDIANRSEDADDGGISEDQILQLLQSMIKQRRDSIEAYLWVDARNWRMGRPKRLTLFSASCLTNGR